MESEKEQLVDNEMVLPYLLGDDSERAAHGATRWAYGNNAGIAYSAFLDVGRGFLWGPLPMDLDGNQMDHKALMTAVAAGELFKLPMVYGKPEDFPLSTLPPTSLK